MIAIIILQIIVSTYAAEFVQYAAVIYRHGDRTPVEQYPTDPYKNESLWPVKFGELTNLGKQQHYALGQWLRKRYSNLLSEDFDPSEIYIRSTDVDRTLMSAEANLAGIYPPSKKSMWKENLLWQPIPIHTKPDLEDEVLAMKKNCFAYNKEKERVSHSKAYIERLSKYQDLMNYLTVYSGKKIKDYYDIEYLYNNMNIETIYNFTLPNWTHSVYPDKMKEPSCYSFSTSAATPLLARLRAGPLLKEVMSKMTKSITNSTNQLKMSIYSGHDFTIGTLLTALGVFDLNCPVYTATIFLDLLYDNSTASHYIRISYRNSSAIVEPYILNIPYCGQKCPVERFIKLYENLLTVNFDQECGKQFSMMLTIYIFFGGLLILATLYGAHKMHIAKINRQHGLQCAYANVQLSEILKKDYI